MRTWVVFVLALGAASANASFELALVLDKNNLADNAVNTAIMRFDPETGTYLGEFGRGIVNGNCTSMKLDQANNIVNVLEAGGSILQFNYNTGAYLGEVLPINAPAGSLGTGANNGMLTGWVGGYDYILAYNANASYLGYYHASAASMWAYSYNQDGRVYAYDNVSKNLVSWAAGALYTNHSASASANPVNLVTGYKMVSQGNRLLLTGKGAGASNGYGFVITLAGGGSISAVSQITLPFSNWSTGVATGHGDIAYFTGYNTVDAARVTRVNTLTSRTRGTFGEGYLTKPQDIVVVTAPEPASLAILALGAGALLRRRRS